MWSKRFNLLFYLRKPKNYKGGKQPVYMRITIDGARTDLSTQRECSPERWNSRAGRASGTKEEIRVLNAYVDSLQTKVYEAHRGLIDNKEPITIENFKRRLKGNEASPRMILEVFQHHNNQVEQLYPSGKPHIFQELKMV